MRVAVTGASGFLGVNLVDRLVESRHEVVALDRKIPDGPPREGVSWARADVLDPVRMRAALDGAEVVYHLAAVITLAHRDDRAWKVNTQGVRTVAEAAAAAGVRRMVHCSSIHSFDQHRCGGRIDESAPRSTDPGLPVYDRSKWQGEVELHSVIDSGLDAVICNPTGVYGPVDYGLSRINAILRDAARGRVPMMVDGTFDLVDVRDVADGLIAAADKGRTGENYLLPGHMTRMLAACRLAANATGRRGPWFGLPLRLVEAITPIAEPIGAVFGSDLVSRASLAALRATPIVDGAKARAELGYRARPAAETIRDLVEFFVATGRLDRTPRVGAEL
ncbi:NAD-dependent epimerase/dehydratase family protein [Nocardia sp. ET3-3]|uniref:NAD-dependent epimerase/dehydratase family protein n=1 Tax=Nocardia terrae TaxID=2675851 RepID=A0A7K1UUL8_9NOCA|nr:NAD-dependent epimerase/dehydratase family protein [Nocardia terrae]MVU77558.1 NAD-dependent epimerase/dehydratase family protein [Nocardia terrae]